MDVGKRLVDLKEKTGMTRTALSKKSGVALSFINDIERGEKEPTIHTLKRLCEALGVSLAEFFLIEQDLSFLPDDLYKFVIKKENWDTIRFIAEMKEKGMSSEGIIEILKGLIRIIEDMRKKDGKYGFYDTKRSADEYLSKIEEIKNKK